MSGKQTTGAQAVGRAFELFEAVVRDGGQSSLGEIGDRLGIAASSVRRYAKLLLDRGIIVRIAKGRYAGSEQLRAMLENIDPLSRLVAVARPILARAASLQSATAHLGTFENDMVTYLVREGTPNIFTREQAQLEAYCTGIGKALLSQLPKRELDEYLRTPLVKLTPTTIVDGDAMRRELETIRRRGYAIDDGEMEGGLICIAAPLAETEGRICAISLSYPSQRLERLEIARSAKLLMKSAEQINARVASMT